MFDDINDLYQQVILDHCKKPRNFHEMPAATCSAQGHNPLCGDNLKLFLTLEGDVIKEAAPTFQDRTLRTQRQQVVCAEDSCRRFPLPEEALRCRLAGGDLADKIVS